MSNDITCPACQNSSRKPFGQKNNLNIYICSNCKTLYTPIEKDAQSSDMDWIDKFYDDYYSEKNELPAMHESINGIVADIIATFEPFRQNNRLLDVGAGSGNLLAIALQAGWQAEGVEVSQSSFDFLIENNFKVFHGDLHSAGFPSDYFDVVTCSEVIEHVPRSLSDGDASGFTSRRAALGNDTARQRNISALTENKLDGYRPARTYIFIIYQRYENCPQKSRL